MTNTNKWTLKHLYLACLCTVAALYCFYPFIVLFKKKSVLLKNCFSGMHAQILHFNKCSHRFSVDFIGLGVMTVVPPLKALRAKTMQITKMYVVIFIFIYLFIF